MTEQINPEQNVYRWTPQLFEQAKLEARSMTVERLPKFIEDCMKRCERDDQAIGAMVLAGIAATTAALACRKQKPSSYHLAQAAMLLYAEMMRISGPFRTIFYEYMLHPGQEKHFEPVVDWQAAQWLMAEAQARLLGVKTGEKAANWLSRISLGMLPYGWQPEKPPVPSGFKPFGKQ